MNMIKFNKKYNKAIGLAMAALAFTACSDDWDDHYNVQSQLQGDGTLWQALVADDNLKNFRDVLEVCGYDSILNGAQAFTLFAPTNENLSAEKAQEWIETYTAEKAKRVQDEDNTTIKKFVRNHIAMYNHSVSGNSSDSILLMNGKYCVLEPHSVGGKAFVTKNQKHTNGVLFTVKEPIGFFANVYETLGEIKDVTPNDGTGLDSVAAFFARYEKYEFLPGESVPGEIVDGKTQYLDSVFWFENTLFDELCYQQDRHYNEYGRYRYNSGLNENLDLTDEDSTYWIVAPTNKEWNRLVEEYSPYFEYASNIENYDSLCWMMPRMAIVDGSIFSRYRNVEAFDEGSAASVVSTSGGVIPNNDGRLIKYGSLEPEYCYYQYFDPFGAGGIFNGAEAIESSNGKVWKASTWNIDKTRTFCQLILIEAENSQVQMPDTAKNSPTLPLSTVDVSSDNPFYSSVSGSSYVVIAPKTTSNPEARFYIDNVLSNVPYDIYAVFVPATAGDTLATADERLPNKIRFTMYWTDKDGRERDEQLQSSVEIDFDPDGDGVESLQGIKLTGDEGFVFPTCSKGLGNSVHQAWLELKGRAGRTGASKTIRLDYILLKPRVE